MGVLSNFVKRHFGVEVRFNPNPIVSTVQTAATQLWRGNPDRLQLTFINLGANIIYLFVDPSVSASRGIYLAPGGGSVILTAEEDGELVGYPWWALAATAVTNIFSAEVEGV